MSLDTLIPLASALLGGVLALAGSHSTNRFTRWNNELVSQRELLSEILITVRGAPLLANSINNLARTGVQLHTTVENRKRLLEPANNFGLHNERLLQKITQARLRISEPSVLRALQQVENSLLRLQAWGIEAVNGATKAPMAMPDTYTLETITEEVTKSAKDLEKTAINTMQISPPLTIKISRLGRKK